MNKGFFHFLGGANSGVGFENGIYPVILSEINSIKIADENQDDCYGIVYQHCGQIQHIKY